MTFWELLQRRVRTDGARPLVTCYDAGGGRTELSAISYANWVAKTANLLTDTVGAEAGDLAGLPLLARHPGHWMTLAWVGACWAAGLRVAPVASSEDVVTVCGPELDLAPSRGEQYACSLHPWGLGFTTPLPDGVQDYANEVRTEPDAFLGQPAAGSDVAWNATTQEAELLAGPGSAERVAVDVASDVAGKVSPYAVVTALLVAPVVGGGSSVAVLGGDVVAVAEAERATVTPLAKH